MGPKCGIACPGTCKRKFPYRTPLFPITNCYQIPVAWGPTGVIRLPKVQGLGAYTAPDGTPIQSGEAVYPLTSIWIAE